MDTYPSDLQPARDGRQERGSGILGFIVDVLETLILSLVLFVGINFVSARIRVDGASMEPTLHSGELVIVNKLAYKLSLPKEGDIIVFHFPRDPQQEYIKRVIGLPGDQVSIHSGVVYINGQALAEPYLKSRPAYPGDWVVPEGQLFVLGDNRNNSSDSHNWGTVPLEYVIGKALAVYWPPESWGVVTHVSAATPTP